MNQKEKKKLFEQVYHALTKEGYDTPASDKGIAIYKDLSISNSLEKHTRENPCIFWMTHTEVYNQRAIFKHCHSKFRNTCVFVRTDYVDWANMIVSMVSRHYKHNLKHVFDTKFLTSGFINYDGGEIYDEEVEENPFENIFLKKFPLFKKLLESEAKTSCYIRHHSFNQESA